ncbi:MlaD family protein [Desulfococcaceae bacterium HSG7]|nr:MlaD family protein [Desulfococcaceae bacterium HSG7]
MKTTEPDTNEPARVYEPPEPEIRTRKRRRFSIVWLVPLAAAAIGLFLVYKTFTEKGPQITITFESAEGLEAGKTKIKYKNVELGVVETINLSPDLSHVILIAQLRKEADVFLSANTRFWVERARVAAGKVSGIGTLLSGAYIGMDPGKPGEKVLQFKGLETPPIVTADLPGRHFVLQTPRLGSLDIGAPVYFRQIKVGQIVSFNLDDDGEAVTIKVFIHAPHHQRVFKNTRFWNASGLDFVVDAKGIRMNTESLVTLLLGGIAFDTPTDLEERAQATANEAFKLHADFESIFEKAYARKINLLLYFDGSVRGLAVGAPVEFRGIQLGKVLDVKLKFDLQKQVFRIPVLIEIEPGRINVADEIPADNPDHKIMDNLVDQGMRARLKTGNLLTGQLFVDLDIYPDAPEAHILWKEKYPRMPTMPTRMDEISASLTQLLQQIQEAPINEFFSDLHHTVQGADRLINSAQLHNAISSLDKTLQGVARLINSTQLHNAISSLDKTLQGADRLINSAQLHNAIGSLDKTLDHTRLFAKTLDTDVAPELKNAISELNATLKNTQNLTQNLDANVTPKLGLVIKQAQTTLTAIGGTLSQDSPVFHELIRMLRELADAARFIRDLADYLERHPDALIYGKTKQR